MHNLLVGLVEEGISTTNQCYQHENRWECVNPPEHTVYMFMDMFVNC